MYCYYHKLILILPFSINKNYKLYCNACAYKIKTMLSFLFIYNFINDNSYFI